ncbi:MAG: hypothetical protein QOF70_706 [Acetobacteraceae bacterium]|jgi:hypothetical protein|nr:hypothetical protein [Acetobacteraceae bacterium]
MPTQGFLVAELSQIISQATAPAFLLGAVAAFISVLIGRLNRIVDRGLALAVIEGNDPPMGQLKASIPSLRRRAKLLSRALECAVIAAIFITLLVIAAFASAAVGLNQVYGAAVLFVLALGFFAASLICLLFEVRIAVAGLAQIL